jgi:hypothetical protein
MCAKRFHKLSALRFDAEQDALPVALQWQLDNDGSGLDAWFVPLGKCGSKVRAAITSKLEGPKTRTFAGVIDHNMRI